jgi:hypothetical protein
MAVSKPTFCHYTDVMDQPSVLFGFPEEWEDFRHRHPRFEEVLPTLKAVLSLVFDRAFHASKPIESFVHLYGRMCMEEFYEILLMCGNGYGIGAQKILRGFWEKAVTLEYLSNNPKELDNFFDFHYIADYKLFNSVRNIVGGDALSEQMVSENHAGYEKVKARFEIDDCKKCGTKRVNHTWSKLDIVSMSKKTRRLKELVNQAYYVPMRHTHSTANSFVQRIETTDDGGLAFNPDAQRELADSALRTSHFIVLEVLDIEQRFYLLTNVKEKLSQCWQDWQDLYKRPKVSPEDESSRSV